MLFNTYLIWASDLAPDFSALASMQKQATGGIVRVEAKTVGVMVEGLVLPGRFRLTAPAIYRGICGRTGT
jgi:hypothetical protein